jgi:ABC-2 type transport system ATP-binding protein
MSSTRASAGVTPELQNDHAASTAPPSTAAVAATDHGDAQSSHQPRTPPTSIPPLGVYASALTKTFGDHDVIKPLDLHVEPGTIVGLIGPSGCGKTTTVRLLTGLLQPTSGIAAVSGTPSHELTSRERGRIGYLPQTPALFPDLSLAENLSFHASMYGLPFRRRRRLNELLDWVELGEHRSKRVSDSSGGMQRRLSLAAAFVHDPDVVFLDEPTAGIDPILRDKFWARFRELAAQGKTLVVTTQYVGEASECDLVGLLSDGEMLLLDTPANLRKAAFEGEVVDVKFADPIGDDTLHRLAQFDFVVGGADRVDTWTARLIVDNAETALANLGSGLDALGLQVEEVAEHVVDYDEAFVQIVERHRSGAAAVGQTEAGMEEMEEIDTPGERDRQGEMDVPQVDHAEAREREPQPLPPPLIDSPSAPEEARRTADSAADHGEEVRDVGAP